MKIQVIDLFCGGGGASQGFKEAGAKVALAIDNWEPAIKLHQYNHPEIPIMNYQLGNDIQEIINLFFEFLEEGGHVHLHGSPPCQAISTASVQNYRTDEGYFMLNWFIELANVFGDLCRYMGYSYSWSCENVLPFKSYCIERKIPFFQINSAELGTPQDRKRVIAGEGWIYEPKLRREQWISVKQALPYLDHEIKSSKIQSLNWGKKKMNTSYPMKTITGISQHQIFVKEKLILNVAGYVNGKSRKTWENDISLPSRSIHNNTPILRYDIDENKAEKFRILTLDEICILMGYPNFKYEIPNVKLMKKDIRQIIGNMVTPSVSKAIIEGIVKKTSMKTLFQY